MLDWLLLSRRQVKRPPKPHGPSKFTDAARARTPSPRQHGHARVGKMCPMPEDTQKPVKSTLTEKTAFNENDQTYTGKRTYTHARAHTRTHIYTNTHTHPHTEHTQRRGVDEAQDQK